MPALPKAARRTKSGFQRLTIRAASPHCPAMTQPADPETTLAGLLGEIRACSVCAAHLPHGVGPEGGRALAAWLSSWFGRAGA